MNQSEWKLNRSGIGSQNEPKYSPAEKNPHNSNNPRAGASAEGTDIVMSVLRHHEQRQKPRPLKPRILDASEALIDSLG